MARDSSGTYTRVNNSFSNPVTGTTISSTHADALFDDVETEMTDSYSRSIKGGMLANGTASLPAFTWSSDLNTGIYRIGADNLGIAVGGTKIVDVASIGAGITGAGSAAFSVGANGTTNPVFQVDAATASVATGVKITGAAAASRVAVAAISSGTDEGLSIDAKGAGTIRLGATSTGAVEFSRNAVPTASDGAALGTTALMWSDAFLASGAVINFNAGNYTITHSAGDLAFSGIVTVPNTGLHLLDTNASHDLIVKPGSDLTADHTLTITTGDADRTLDISAASVTVSSFGATVVDDADAATARATLGAAPAGATYVTLSTNSELSAERVLTAGTGVSITDGGAGTTATVALAAMAAYTLKGNNTGSSAVPGDIDIALVTTKASPAAGDYILISDQDAAGAFKKATVSSVSAAGSVASIDGTTGAFTISGLLARSANDLRVLAATQAEQETGTSTTIAVTPGRQQYHTSAAKGWCKVDSAASFTAYNVSGVTDVGTGQVTVTWDADFSTANYAMPAQALEAASSYLCNINAQATTSCTLQAWQVGVGRIDVSQYYVAAFGDI